MSRSIANIGAGEDSMADQGRSGIRFPVAVRVRSSFSLGLRVVVGASSLVLLCSAAASSISTAGVSSGDRSKFTSIPPLSSPPGWSLRTILKRQKLLAAITDAANKHNVERAKPAKVDAAGHLSVSRVRLAVVGVAVGDHVGGSDGSSSRHTVQTERQPTTMSHRTCPFKFTMPTPAASVLLSTLE